MKTSEKIALGIVAVELAVLCGVSIWANIKLKKQMESKKSNKEEAK